MSAAIAFLWVPFTLAAATGQVVRNGAQAQLTAKIGTLGATPVRFVFGLPFAIAFLGLALLFTGDVEELVGGSGGLGSPWHAASLPIDR